ncbi:hypothetical protein BV898_12836 [Hypsibius exemplaris]|uniref:Uncharacterized protein n=1 Tax=Hypsibius exemplaris TaxID=2072580 RepID=A0A1W0WCG4_HYPEX|nr:hypothetical protein BV898_12836 [Hypsibius exemplaris]
MTLTACGDLFTQKKVKNWLVLTILPDICQAANEFGSFCPYATTCRRSLLPLRKSSSKGRISKPNEPQLAIQALEKVAYLPIMKTFPRAFPRAAGVVANSLQDIRIGLDGIAADPYMAGLMVQCRTIVPGEEAKQ